MHPTEVGNNEVEDRLIKKITLAAFAIAVAAGAASIYAASNSSGGRLIPGSGPITEQQIRDKLTADGFSNIQIRLKGGVFETVATKDGRQAELAVDAQSGTVRTDRDDDDDD
jgi:hypothetical protein